VVRVHEPFDGQSPAAEITQRYSGGRCGRRPHHAHQPCPWQPTVSGARRDERHRALAAWVSSRVPGAGGPTRGGPCRPDALIASDPDLTGAVSSDDRCPPAVSTLAAGRNRLRAREPAAAGVDIRAGSLGARLAGRHSDDVAAPGPLPGGLAGPSPAARCIPGPASRRHRDRRDAFRSRLPTTRLEEFFLC
jgi:hypothetical protein